MPKARHAGGRPAPRAPIAPGGRIGILGGGQLGRMLALAAAEMGMEAVIYAPEARPPAAAVAAAHRKASYEDKRSLRAFAAHVDVLTYELEQIPLSAVHEAAKVKILRPSPFSLEITQNRLLEKNFLKDHAIPTAPFSAFPPKKEFPLPAIIKSCYGGYDGKGQTLLKNKMDLKKAQARFTKRGFKEGEALIEERMRFQCEISIVAARAVSGRMRFWDAAENLHRDGILRESRVPARIPASVEKRARLVASKIAKHLDHVGVLAVEFFLCEKNGAPHLLVNEIAPRVHNSGHWTMDAAQTSQFTQHIRAICGWPLTSTRRLADAKMINLLGADAHEWRTHAKGKESALHLYGKTPIRKGRKMGHLTKLYPLSERLSG